MPWLGYASERHAPTENSAVATKRRIGGAISAHISEAILAQLPAFKPPPPPTAKAAAPEPVDVPVILERVIVTEKQVPRMGEFRC